MGKLTPKLSSVKMMRSSLILALFLVFVSTYASHSENSISRTNLQNVSPAITGHFRRLDEDNDPYDYTDEEPSADEGDDDSVSDECFFAKCTKDNHRFRGQCPFTKRPTDRWCGTVVCCADSGDDCCETDPIILSAAVVGFPLAALVFLLSLCASFRCCPWSDRIRKNCCCFFICFRRRRQSPSYKDQVVDGFPMSRIEEDDFEAEFKDVPTANRKNPENVRFV